MGLHTESAYAKCSALEAEMRRRLWWSLILFDSRICELVDYKTSMLVPTWDCKIPLNVNDFDLQPEMKNPPAVQGKSTETLFAVVRSEMGDFLRHSAFNLDFINPALKAIAKDVQRGPIPEGGELVTLETIIEDHFLKFCNQENPLHFMTTWMARGYIAKYRLIEYYSTFSRSSVHQTEVQRDAANSHALRMLKCDTKLMTSPLTKGYLWLVRNYFPFPAYLHIVQDLRRRPVGDHAEYVWEKMNDNYEARFMFLDTDNNPFFTIFTTLVMQAWEARKAVFRQSGKPLVPPQIVSDITQRLSQRTPGVQNADIEQPVDGLSMNVDEFPVSTAMNFGGIGPFPGMGWQNYIGTGTGPYPNMGQTALDADVNQLDWSAMDWNPMHGRGC